MKRERVVGSNNVTSIGYEDGKLHIEFRNGAVYEYTGPIVADHFAALQKAQSKGGYISKTLRSCTKTKCVKLEKAT